MARLHKKSKHSAQFHRAHANSWCIIIHCFLWKPSTSRARARREFAKRKKILRKILQELACIALAANFIPSTHSFQTCQVRVQQMYELFICGYVSLPQSSINSHVSDPAAQCVIRRRSEHINYELATLCDDGSAVSSGGGKHCWLNW